MCVRFGLFRSAHHPNTRTAVMRLQLVLGAGFLGSLAVLTHAYMLKKQFYPTTVFLVSNSLGMSVCFILVSRSVDVLQAIYYQVGILAFLLMKLCSFIFFGSLRTTEVEVALYRRVCLTPFSALVGKNVDCHYRNLFSNDDISR